MVARERRRWRRRRCSSSGGATRHGQGRRRDDDLRLRAGRGEAEDQPEPVARSRASGSDHKINIIDTPGYADFVGEVKSGIRAADFGVDRGRRRLGRAGGHGDGVAARGRGEACRGSSSSTAWTARTRTSTQAVQQLQARYGKKIAPLELPIGVAGPLLRRGEPASRTRRTWATRATPADVPADMADAVAAAREQLVEAVAEADDDLLAKYLEGEELDRGGADGGAAEGDRGGHRVPGVRRLGDEEHRRLEVPRRARRRLPVAGGRGAADREGGGRRGGLKADAAAPLAALVFKTAADPFVGRLTYLRVVSGTLKGDSHVWNANQNADERIGQLHRAEGQDAGPRAVAGGGRHRRGGEAGAHGHGRHALHEGARGDAAADRVPEAAVQRRGDAEGQGGRRQARAVAAAHRGGGPDAGRAPRRDDGRDDHLRHGRDARRGGGGEDEAQVRRRGGPAPAARAVPRDGDDEGGVGVHPQEADGRPRPVRARGDHGRAEQGRRLRVRRQGGRRLGAAKLHPGRREGRARGAAARARWRTSRWWTCG